jgi:hypothetical protein
MESRKHFAWGGGVIGVVGLLVVVAWLSVVLNADGGHKSQPPEPLVPTVVVVLSDSSSDGSSDSTMGTADDGAHYTELASRRFSVDSQPEPEPYSTLWRTGVGVAAISPMAFDWPSPRPGWYLTWSSNLAEIGSPYASPEAPDMNPPEYEPLGMEFVPMIRMQKGRLYADDESLTALAQHNPGRTWLIGNEPDVAWQDNTTPEEYALAYHQAYTAIKVADPDAKIAIGGVSQITPLRLAYLDRIRGAYEEEFGEVMPVDVWNMHAFVLREERDNWGVSIPPGFDDVDSGILWEVEEHNNLHLVENQVRLMRSWMAGIGEGDKPLWITEYGILMPEEYGFPPETVDAFMTDSFDLFETLSDERTGFPDDDYRLVQRWAWFSTYFRLYPTGNLFDSNGMPTALMESMSNYLELNGD